MSFNPANFPFTMPALTPAPLDAAMKAQKAVALKVAELEQAAARFALRRDSFAVGKQHTCLDMAARLDKFKAFASDKQAEFADKLIAWSLPREASASPVAAQTPMEAALPRLPRLFDLMQRLSQLTVGGVKVRRKNGDSLCWVMRSGPDGAGAVVGKIENGQLHLWRSRMGAAVASETLNELIRIEQDPEAAAVLHGKASGCCAVCSRDLTDPVSIERGIGPICAEKF